MGNLVGRRAPGPPPIAQAGELLHQWLLHAEIIVSYSAQSGQRVVLAAFTEGAVVVHALPGGQLVGTLTYPVAQAQNADRRHCITACGSSDTRPPLILTGHQDGQICVFDGETLTFLHAFQAHPAFVFSMAVYDREGGPRVVSVGGEGAAGIERRVLVSDPTTGQVLCTSLPPSSSTKELIVYESVGVGPRVIIPDRAGRVVVCDPEAGKVVYEAMPEVDPQQWAHMEQRLALLQEAGGALLGVVRGKVATVMAEEDGRVLHTWELGDDISIYDSVLLYREPAEGRLRLIVQGALNLVVSELDCPCPLSVQRSCIQHQVTGCAPLVFSMMSRANALSCLTTPYTLWHMTPQLSTHTAPRHAQRSPPSTTITKHTPL
jgi:hypothetical protein